MGSQSKIDLAYVAGFLDGDGSLMLQIKRRSDGKARKRFMATICFYQDSRHADALSWIQKLFGIGYLSRRNDGMIELRINGFEQVRNILKNLLPFIRFKKNQAKSLYKAVNLLSRKTLKDLSGKERLKIIDCILIIQNNNYAAKRKKTKQELMKILDLTP